MATQSDQPSSVSGSTHESIQFTMEQESEGQLAFLDVRHLENRCPLPCTARKHTLISTWTFTPITTQGFYQAWSSVSITGLAKFVTSQAWGRKFKSMWHLPSERFPHYGHRPYETLTPIQWNRPCQCVETVQYTVCQRELTSYVGPLVPAGYKSGIDPYLPTITCEIKKSGFLMIRRKVWFTTSLAEIVTRSMWVKLAEPWREG